jgi:hypothetical protein
MEGSTPELRQEMQKIDTNKFFCGSIVCIDCEKPCDSSKKKPCLRNFFKCENEYDLFNRVFEKSHQFHNAQTSEKVTPKYWVVYDNRDGRSIIPYYFKIHNKRKEKNFLQIKTGISPMVRKHAVFTILGPKDSVYIIDETALQYYEDQETKVSEVFQKIKPTGVAATDGSNTDGVTASKDVTEKDQQLPELYQSLALSKFNEYENMKGIPEKFDFVRENFSPLMNIQFNKSIEERAKSSKEDSANIVGLLDRYVEAIRDIQILQNENASLADRIKELEKLKKKNENQIAGLTKKIDQKEKELTSRKKELIAANKEISRLKESLENKPNNQEFYVNLKALERDLEKMNAQYEDISFVEKQFQADKLCLQLKIKSVLGVTTVQSSTGLAAALIDKVTASKVDTMHFGAFNRLIKDIEYQYGVLMGKKAKYSIFSSSKKTPNTDEFVKTIRTKNVVTPFITDTFKTSWGLKIDFSTGIFINGLANSEFGTTPHTFRYRETKDTVVVRGGIGIDSVMYTGQIKNTTGNLINSNNPKFSYSAGFLVHVYPRTGTFVNAGIVTGVTINNSNSSPIQLMLGGCLMFNASKSSRVSIVGGCTWGQVKELSGVIVPYKWDKDKDPDNRLYNSIHDVPRFYNGSSDLLTFNKWKKSWFFGITYNFASLNVGK